LLFLTLRPPPTSPLFPYTTLFRSGFHESRDHRPGRRRRGGRDRARAGQLRRVRAAQRRNVAAAAGRLPGGVAARWRHADGAPARSEEHTSELQSLTNLVCRLLLEK